jgi:hypothetical protein
LFVKIPKIDKYTNDSTKKNANASATPTQLTSIIKNNESEPEVKFNYSGFLKFLNTSSRTENTFNLFNQLGQLNYLNISPPSSSPSDDFQPDISIPINYNIINADMWSNSFYNELCEWHMLIGCLTLNLKRYLRSKLISATTILSDFHEFCLSKFINFAFEMVI